MAFEVLSPISDLALAHIPLQHFQSLGNTLVLHSEQEGIPALDKVDIALVCLRENRRDPQSSGETLSFTEIRLAFYSLFPGNWHLKIADLGDITPGETVEDTYFAVKTINVALIKQGIIPIYIGGSQDLLYPIYRSYDTLDQMVNLVNVDSRFDLGDANKPLQHQSYVGKIIVDKPYNLFNYSNIGYQTYLNPQEEIDLMERLYFDTYRLGNISADLAMVEPVMRDADIVSVDLAAIRSSELSVRHNQMPNGFDGKEICRIIRYAGISDRVGNFAIFAYKNDDQEQKAAMLVAQMIWYFIEGVNFRASENLNIDNNDFIKFQVPVDSEVLTFYKSSKTDRWWIEIPFISGINNKLKRHTLLPCTYQDYLDACNQNIPERWYKARKKNEV